MTSTPRMTPFLNKWIWISFFLASVSCRVDKTSFKLTQLANRSRDCYKKRLFSARWTLWRTKKKNMCGYTYVTCVCLRHVEKNSKNYIRIDQNIPLRGHRRRQTIIATTTISRITRTTTTATMVAVKDLEGDSGSFSSEINKQADQYLVKTNNPRLKEGKNKKDRGKSQWRPAEEINCQPKSVFSWVH